MEVSGRNSINDGRKISIVTDLFLLEVAGAVGGARAVKRGAHEASEGTQVAGSVSTE